MKRIASILILLLCGALFAVGILEFFKLRFDAGDVYPPYSSLRSDPLGTMALFESLSRIPGVTVLRDFNTENRLPSGRQNAYLHLAATRDEWLGIPDELVQEIQSYVLDGGRLVIAFLPETSRPFLNPVPSPGKLPPARGPGTKKSAVSPLFKDRWGVDFAFKSLPTGEGGAYEAAQAENRSHLPLPDVLDWHSGMIFTNVDAAWTTIYSRGTNPVVMERKFGPGSVVLMTDSFCLSNEAMVGDRHPDLLSWLIGPARTLEFDEAHLGLTENPGVASLMRKYHLHGLVAAILLLVALFIWQHSASFVPRSSFERTDGDAILGKEASAGFINLLRRNIAPREVLRICFEQWTKSFACRGNHSIARVDQAQAVFAAEVTRAKTDQDPVRAYREIRQALKVTSPRHPAP